MKLNRRPLVAIIPAAVLAGSVLAAPVAGAQSDMGSLSPEAIQGSINGKECTSVTTTATRSINDDGTANSVDGRTGNVEVEPDAIFRIDGWGAGADTKTRIVVGSTKELKNAEVTLKFDERATSVVEGTQHNPSLPRWTWDGMQNPVPTVTGEPADKSVTLELGDMPEDSSIAYEYTSALPGGLEQDAPVFEEALLTADGLAEAGFCEDTPSALGSLTDPGFGSLPLSGSVLAIAIGGGIWAEQNGLIPAP